MTRRNEFPRPDFRREDWLCLNGTWEFSMDKDGSCSLEQGLAGRYGVEIEVPFCYQSQLSNIGIQEDCPVVWYRRKVVLKKTSGKRILLKFGAVDHKASVWVNQSFVGSHEGGYSPFTLDITDAAADGENTIVVRAEDYPCAGQPRGKQTWAGENFA